MDAFRQLSKDGKKQVLAILEERIRDAIHYYLIEYQRPDCTEDSEEYIILEIKKIIEGSLLDEDIKDWTDIANWRNGMFRELILQHGTIYKTHTKERD